MNWGGQDDDDGPRFSRSQTEEVPIQQFNPSPGRGRAIKPVNQSQDLQDQEPYNI
jgi:hypothetical protein